MKRIFFAGKHFGTDGPSEVNKSYVKHLHDRVLHLTMANPLLQFMEIIIKFIFSRVIIFSGIRNIDHILLPLCRLFHKRILFIMHGCLEYENGANHYYNPRGERNEALMLRDTHQILCVSEPFRRWVVARYPEYVTKTATLTNGINWEMMSSSANGSQCRDKQRIILIGGGRITKHNIDVCRAVEMLNNMVDKQYHIDVYGPYYDNDDSNAISRMPYTTWHGLVSHETLLQAMQGAALFIQNSSFEPFSLGVVEALVCGCNVLLSVNVGARDVIPGITEKDLITDPTNLKELAQKIEWVTKVGNNQRLLSSIDCKATSCETVAEKLYQIAVKMCK